MKHIGRNQQIITVGVESLLYGVFFDIQHPVLDTLIAEQPLCLREEARRDIRVHVVVPPFGKLRQDGFGRRSGTRPDLNHPQVPSFGQPGYKCAHRVSQHPVRRSIYRCLEIEIRGAGFSAAEEKRQRILFAAKHFRQGTRASAKNPDLA